MVNVVGRIVDALLVLAWVGSGVAVWRLAFAKVGHRAPPQAAFGWWMYLVAASGVHGALWVALGLRTGWWPVTAIGGAVGVVVVSQAVWIAYLLLADRLRPFAERARNERASAKARRDRQAKLCLSHASEHYMVPIRQGRRGVDADAGTADAPLALAIAAGDVQSLAELLDLGAATEPPEGRLHPLACINTRVDVALIERWRASGGSVPPAALEAYLRIGGSRPSVVAALLDANDHVTDDALLYSVRYDEPWCVRAVLGGAVETPLADWDGRLLESAAAHWAYPLEKVTTLVRAGARRGMPEALIALLRSYLPESDGVRFLLDQGCRLTEEQLATVGSQLRGDQATSALISVIETAHAVPDSLLDDYVMRTDAASPGVVAAILARNARVTHDALQRAMRRSSVEVVELLLTGDLDTDLAECGGELLMTARDGARADELVALLVARGVDDAPG